MAQRKMQPAKRFQDLLAWQRAHQLTLAIYALTAAFPKHELYGLTSQMRRAAVSIAANIAEGFRRFGSSDKLRFFNLAHSSLEEVRYYLILSGDLDYADPSKLFALLDETSRLLYGYIAATTTKEKAGRQSLPTWC